MCSSTLITNRSNLHFLNVIGAMSGSSRLDTARSTPEEEEQRHKAGEEVALESRSLKVLRRVRLISTRHLPRPIARGLWFCRRRRCRGLSGSARYQPPLLFTLSPSSTGSTHGYDVVNPHQVNKELGGPEAHAQLCATLKENGLGQVLDIVPNHMAIAGRENPWWWDVLGERAVQPLCGVFRPRVGSSRSKASQHSSSSRAGRSLWAGSRGGRTATRAGRRELRHPLSRSSVSGLAAVAKRSTRNCG